MFTVVYKFSVHEGQGEAFVAHWSTVTTLLQRYAGSLGSRLHRSNEGEWIAYAQWPSRAVYDQKFSNEELATAGKRMRETLERVAVLHELEVVRDHLNAFSRSEKTTQFVHRHGERLTLDDRPPSAAEYCELRKACGLSEKTEQDALAAMPKSVFSVSLRNEDRDLVGMGRLIGDGTCFLQVVDIAVHPSYQGRKLSSEILETIKRFIDQHAPRAYVSLFADVDFLYEKYGFAESARSKGMVLVRETTDSN